MKYKKLFLITHFIVGGAVLTLLLSGLRIASQQRDFWLYLDWLLPEGLVHIWHMLAGMFLLVSLPLMLFALYKHRKESAVLKAYNLMGSVLLCLSVITGAAQFIAETTYVTIRFIHYYSAIGLLVFILLHPLRYYLQKPLAHIYHVLVAPFSYARTYFYLLAIALGSIGLYIFTVSSPTSLEVAFVSDNAFIRIDGNADESVWQDATSISVDTFAGANFYKGTSKVTLKALHNSTETYFFIRWQDPTESLLHLPLVKTEKGWQVKSNGFNRFDETEFYEDKFAVLFSKSCNIAAAATAHLGSKPRNDLPKNVHKKGYHFSNNGVVDLWQWKAVRTNAMYLVDDSFIGEPTKPVIGQARYTAGYQQDSDMGGSYVMNWKWYNENIVTPKRLPKTSFAEPRGYGSWFDYQPFSVKADSFPVGSIINSVLYRSNQLEGGRADVRAHAVYKDGFWNLEVVRKTLANERTDIDLSEGVCMWVSAFDHAQIAHTRHIKPLRLHYQL